VFDQANQGAKEAATELGTTPAEVAASLATRGVKGVRNTVRILNPIVRFLQTRLRVDATALDVIAGDKVRLRYGKGPSESAAVPQPVQQFIEEFNRGGYPELELPPEQS